MDTIKDPRNCSLKNMKSTSLHTTEPTSLSTLIVWNFSKAIEKSPTLDIKEAVISAQSRLETISDAGDIQTMLSDNPYDRHLACALLAWQQLGHSDADSLCRFVENKTNKEECLNKLSSSHVPFNMESVSRTAKGSKMSIKIVSQDIGSTSQDSGQSRYEEASCFASLNSFSMGPVVKLPVETKIVMRLDNTSRCGRPGSQTKKPRAPEKDIIQKIDQACCMDSPCAERLAAMDATTTELRTRAGTLARREAERVELLERAEAAWKDLELGYQRRLTLAEEKEEDIAKQITKMLEERVNYKNACTVLAKDLKDRTGRAEIERTHLSELEKQVCERACKRMRISEESAKGDAVVAEQSCRAAQLDRDLQFKEEQARRNMCNMQSEVATMRAITCEGERATRSELSALRDQIAEVSNKLLNEDAQSEKTKTELEDLRQEKMGLIEDLDGCKALCDGRMKERMDILIKKRDQLAKLRDKVMECRCKVPVHVAVEVKRTPSLAALCKCTPEDKILECCSCTSMRTKLLSNLFSDLFGGLQGELSGTVALMPCQLLKCLEDKHNWDRASAVKSNLKNYFSKLLVGELDIAIATSIEKYHAKWVGISCADAIKMTPSPEDDTEKEGWQERAIERRAQKLASQLAEQLFQERAEELTKRARDIVQAGPPPCECDIKAKLPEGCSCRKPSTTSSKPGTETQVYWHEAMQDITQQRIKMEYLKDGGPPERDLNDEVERKSAKQGQGKVRGWHANKNGESLKSDDVVLSAAVTLQSWQQTMQDVTLLRFQIEDLKKESIKKEDLKMMEDKITKIINRASGGTASTSPKVKCVTDDYVANNVIKYSKTNKAVNQARSHLSEIDKPTTTKNIFGSIAKEFKAKPILKSGIIKPQKKSNQEYAVNVCLCSTKRQEQKEINERRKHETREWKQSFLKDTVSHMSSSIRQSKPIHDSFISQDASAGTYSKDYDEKSCPSNCVCFHKIPSNTSIDQLLKTLAKWKGDLDASFTENHLGKISCCNFSKNNYKCLQNDNTTFESKTSLKSRVKSQEIAIEKRQDLLSYQGSDHKIGLEPSNTILFGKMSSKSNVPVAPIDSVYMGAVNLDKSHDELCVCNNGSKKNKKTPFQCIASSKCTCEKTLEARKVEGKTMHDKKEKSKDISKQERRVNEIIVLPSTPKILKNKETKKAQSLEKQMNRNITNEKTDARAFRNSDYQIHFLGVTLVDVNPKPKNQAMLESDNCGYNNKNVMTNNTSPCEFFYPDNGKSKNYLQDYSGKSNRPVPELTTYINNTDKRNRYAFKSNNDDIEYPDSLVNNTRTGRNKPNEMCKTYHKNEESDEDFNKNAMLLSYIEESQISQLHKNIKYKNSNLGCKTTSVINISNLGGDNDQLHKLYFKVKADEKNSHESEISKKSYQTASENNQLIDKTITKVNGQEKHLAEGIIKKTQSSSSNQNAKFVPDPQMLSCECSIQLDELKKFINANFTKHTANADVALDIQSLKNFKERNESCVCCSKLKNDDCRDLEDNTFNLLEEYLKKKLNEFKASTCSLLCIPAEEEERIFSVIVQRVKRLISDSTNQIACKCSIEERKSQGSWNRAYGLLQEYLKIKIKRVQCSCLLAEDNKDTILPDVLEKISNLIEYDFQRLKNVCNCINTPKNQEKKNNTEKQVNFDAAVPEKEYNILFQTSFSKLLALDDQIGLSARKTIQSNYLQQNIKSQLPLTSAMEDEFCNPQEPNDKNFNHSSIHSLHKHNNCDNSRTNTNIDLSDKNVNESEKNDVSLSNTNGTKITHISSTGMTNKKNKMDSLVKTPTEKTNKAKNLKPNELTDYLNKSKSHSSNLVKNLSPSHSKVKPKSLSASCKKICHQKSKVSKINHCLQNTEEAEPKQQESCILNSSNVPYYGYTINCSCDKSLGPCICPKNATNTNPIIINDIWKKSIPDETYFDKYSYILHKQPTEEISKEADSSITLKKTSANDNRKSEATCCVKLEPIVLKTSSYDVVKFHVETNTSKDNASLDTACSNNEDIDWCECTSQFNPTKHADNDRLKRSIYFPAPIEDYDDQSKDDNSNQDTSSRLHGHVCYCERVPICHVKMLVENIETKLANAYCTCDSLIPKVCPVHSTMC